jgi:biotin carboxylase
MNVLMISPGYPPEMEYFARGLSRVGAKVYGIGDSAQASLPQIAKDALSGYLQIRNLWDEAQTVEAVRQWSKNVRIDRVECLWEPGMILAARLRESLGLPGMTVAETVPFRDKESMKQVLDKAGIRTPRHHRAKSAPEIRAAAKDIGWPVIIKPIAGAGSADTWRCDSDADLERAIAVTRHVQEFSVEEFIEAEEFTFDTVCADGKILYYNISWYRPRPLIARQNEWVTSQTIALRNPDQPYLAEGVKMGKAVIQALGFRTGFTHMEWFRKANGEAVFGEIACRAAGARTTEIMNYACDVDVWTGWAEAVCHKRWTQPIDRRWNACILFKRAQGQGRIQRVTGLDRWLAEFGEFVVSVELLPIGAPRRNWKQTLISDGWVIFRHPDESATVEIADRFSTDVQMYAG